MDRLFRIDFYPQDWIIDTARLTPEERGVYIQIVALIYSNRGPIENDHSWIAGVSGCSSRAVKSIISKLHEKGFIQFSGEKISQKRAENELKNKRNHLELSSKGGRKRAENELKNKRNHLELSSKGGRKRAENESEAKESKDLSLSESHVSVSSPSPSPSPSPTAKDKETTSPPAEPYAPEIQMAVSLYNEVARKKFLPIPQKITEARRKKIKARLKDAGGLEGWRKAIEALEASAFLQGHNDRGWKADLDFVIQEKSFTRLLEGYYAERKTPHDHDPNRNGGSGSSKKDRAIAAVQRGLDAFPDPEPFDPETGEIPPPHEG